MIVRDKSIIPKGKVCREEGRTCPYWSMNFCRYLERFDIRDIPNKIKICGVFTDEQKL